VSIRNHTLYFQQEQYKLKQELADLAIALNMESHKSRTQTFEASK